MPSTPSRHARLTAADWITAAEAALVDGGLDAVAVEAVARRLGTTKGSFYWHFTDRAALVRATLDAWLARTDLIIENLLAVEEPGERLDELFDLAFADTSWIRTETDLLSRVDDPEVARVVERSTRRRIAFIAECLRGLGSDLVEAEDGALQAYALWIGMLQLTAAVPEVIPRGDDVTRFQRSTLTLLDHLRPRVPVAASGGALAGDGARHSG